MRKIKWISLNCYFYLFEIWRAVKIRITVPKIGMSTLSGLGSNDYGILFLQNFNWRIFATFTFPDLLPKLLTDFLLYYPCLTKYQIIFYLFSIWSSCRNRRNGEIQSRIRQKGGRFTTQLKTEPKSYNFFSPTAESPVLKLQDIMSLVPRPVQNISDTVSNSPISGMWIKSWI